MNTNKENEGDGNNNTVILKRVITPMKKKLPLKRRFPIKSQKHSKKKMITTPKILSKEQRVTRDVIRNLNTVAPIQEVDQHRE